MKTIIVEPGDGTHYEFYAPLQDSDNHGEVGFRVGTDRAFRVWEFALEGGLHPNYVREKLEITNEWTVLIATVGIAAILGREPLLTSMELEEATLACPLVLSRTREIIREALK